MTAASTSWLSEIPRERVWVRCLNRSHNPDSARGNACGQTIGRGAAAEQLTDVIAQIRALLEQQIDPLIARLAASEDPARAAFAQTYDRARRIVHLGNNSGVADDDEPPAPPSSLLPPQS